LLQVAADFQPFYPTLSMNVFATRWLSSSGDQLFILINRSGKDLSSQPLLQISADSWISRHQLFSGETINPKTAAPNFAVSVSAEAAGFACVWIGSSDRSPSSVFLSSMSNLTTTPLAELSNTWVAAHTVAQAHLPTAIPRQQPPGMILVPGGVFNFTTNGIEIEGPDGYGVDFPISVGERNAAHTFERFGDAAAVGRRVSRHQQPMERIHQGIVLRAGR